MKPHKEAPLPPGVQYDQWHSFFLWKPTLVRGKWMWLRTVERNLCMSRIMPLCDGPWNPQPIALWRKKGDK